MIRVTRAETPEDLDALRDLVRSFVRWAMATIAKTDNPEAVFAGLEEELAGLPGRYGPPRGGLVLARLDTAPAGCVAFFDRGEGRMEIKRLFVQPEARGHGIGDAMLDLLLKDARAMGHRQGLLWSHHSMHAAHSLYRRAGFREVPVSDRFPGAVDGVDICMEMAL
jgi:GNAT superfamily N-acetyltransferase